MDRFVKPTVVMVSFCSFGMCPYMTEDNKDQLKGKDLLVAYYDVDYEKNPKGSNYWRNRFASYLLFTLILFCTSSPKTYWKT